MPKQEHSVVIAILFILYVFVTQLTLYGLVREYKMMHLEVAVLRSSVTQSTINIGALVTAVEGLNTRYDSAVTHFVRKPVSVGKIKPIRSVVNDSTLYDNRR